MEILDKNHYKENVRHGELYFPINVYNISRHPSGQILPYHWHEEFEFIYLVAGQAVFQVDSGSFEVREGQCLFINSGQLHSAVSRDAASCSYHAVVFNPEILAGDYDLSRDYFQAIKMNQVSIQAVFRGDLPWEREVIAEVQGVLRDFSEAKNGKELAVKARLLRIFALIFANAGYTATAPQNESGLGGRRNIERLKIVIQYIQNNFQRKISLTELAALLHMSPYHFCRVFKQTTGKSPAAYLNYYRINRAAALLEQKETSIMETALNTGFENFSYFIKTFKKYRHCTPSQYRSRHIAD